MTKVILYQKKNYDIYHKMITFVEGISKFYQDMNCEQCIVRQFSALKALNKEDLIKMSNCKTSYTIKKGENIFEEGQQLNGVFCIKSGVCKVSKLSDNGKNHIVKLITKGELLGQRSLINEEPLNLSAIALEDMQVCFIPKADIMSF